MPPEPNWAARVLPVDEQQSCVVCGSREWTWLFPLEAAAGRAFTFGPFLCTCDEHRSSLDSDRADRVAAALAYVADGDPDTARDYADAFMADRLGPPLARGAATSG